jgi:signal transduction histidine kinase
LNIALEKKVEDRTGELRQTVEDLARLNEELKVLDRLKSEFVALVSHELRSPLTNIRTGIELILEGYPDMSGSVRESLELVQVETRRLILFVETLLNLSALEAGRFPLEPTAVPLGSLAERVWDRFPQERRVQELSLHVPPDLSDALADERALESVFFHLFDNALKYAPGGEVQLHAWEEGDQVLASVSDDGPGIPASDREQVFEMFHRLDASDARTIYGHGLGLPMVRRLLQAMDGDIRAEENPQGGARLVFWLPKG